jgi:adenylate cyclase
MERMPAIAASIGLVPFDNLSGDPEQDVLAMGFVEDIAAALSRFESFEVVYPRAAAGTMPGRRGSGAPLATTNVLRGTVRRAGDVIRITVQLLDAQTGR